MAATARRRQGARALVSLLAATALALAALGGAGCSALLGPSYDANSPVAAGGHSAKSPHGSARRSDDRLPAWLAEKNRSFAEEAEQTKTAKPAHRSQDDKAAPKAIVPKATVEKRSEPSGELASKATRTESDEPLDRREFEKYLETVQDPALRPLLEAYWQLHAGEKAVAKEATAANPAAPAAPASDKPAPAMPASTAASATPPAIQQVTHTQEAAQQEPKPARLETPTTAPLPASPADEPAPLAEAPAKSLTPIKPSASPPADAAPEKAESTDAAPSPEPKTKPLDESWRAVLDRAIAALEDEVTAPAGANTTGDSAAKEDSGRLKRLSRSEAETQALDEARLRLLYAAADRREDAARPVKELDDSEQGFWTDALAGVGVMLDPAGHPRPDARASRALSHVRKAAYSLANGGVLEVRNLTLCSKVEGFGRFTPIPGKTVTPGQEVLLYVEIDNFSSTLDSGSGQYETTLQGGYEVRDLSGKRITHYTFPIEKDLCRNRRRDFYMWYRFYVPKASAGEYTLQVTVEDIAGEKFGQTEAVKFVIDR